MAFYQLTVEQNPYIPRELKSKLKAFPKQIEFLCLQDKEALYGGAAGGGKSSALLMAALQFVPYIKNFHAAFFRKTQPELLQDNGPVMRTKQWFNGTDAKWNGQTLRWTFPTTGSTLTFAYAQSNQDVLKYRGAELQFCAFDELTLFTEWTYRYMFSRLRSLKDQGVRVRMRAGTNPGGPGHAWVKERFVDPGDPSRPFIRSFLTDNPALDSEQYLESMAEVDAITRSQQVDGSWDAYEGGRFFAEWFGLYDVVNRNGRVFFLLNPDKDEEDQVWLPAEDGSPFTICDPSTNSEEANDYTSIGTYAKFGDETLLVLDMVRDKFRIDKIVPAIADVYETYEPYWIGMEDAGFMLAILNEARRHSRIKCSIRGLSHESKAKIVRATPAINHTCAGHVYLPINRTKNPWVKVFLDEVTVFTGDEKKDANDDIVDNLAYAVKTSLGAYKGPTVVNTQNTIVSVPAASPLLVSRSPVMDDDDDVPLRHGPFNWQRHPYWRRF